MLRFFPRAGFLAVATLIALTISGTAPTGAAAQSFQTIPGFQLDTAVEHQVAPALPSELPGTAAVPARPDSSATTPATLETLVAKQPDAADLSPEMKCLATAIYYEAGHETLAGQLAVGRVIIARTHSGRFPQSYCGVVRQRSQFSFVRGGVIPEARECPVWHRSVAIARIADAGSFASPVEGALFFHAARVSPNWHAQRMARIDNHIFYQ